jgi:hypothetical protein
MRKCLDDRGASSHFQAARGRRFSCAPSSSAEVRSWNRTAPRASSFHAFEDLGRNHGPPGQRRGDWSRLDRQHFAIDLEGASLVGPDPFRPPRCEHMMDDLVAPDGICACRALAGLAVLARTSMIRIVSPPGSWRPRRSQSHQPGRTAAPPAAASRDRSSTRCTLPQVTCRRPPVLDVDGVVVLLRCRKRDAGGKHKRRNADGDQG